jgi:hypothetical protein
MRTLPRKTLAVAAAALGFTAVLATPALAVGGVSAVNDTATVVEGESVIVDVLGNDTVDPDAGTASVAYYRLADGNGSTGWTATVLEGNAIEITSTGTAATTPVLRIGYTLSNTSGGWDNAYVTVDVAPAPNVDPVEDPVDNPPVTDPDSETDPVDNGGDDGGLDEGTCPAGQAPTPGSISGCGDGTGSTYTVLCQHDYTSTTVVPGTTGTARLGGGVYNRGTHSTVETYTHSAGARLDAPGSGCFDRFQHVGAMGKQTSATSVLTKMLTGSEHGGRLVGPVGTYKVHLTPRMVECTAKGDHLVSCGAPKVIGASDAVERITAKAKPTPKDTPHEKNVPDPKVPTKTIDAGAVYAPVVAPLTHEGGSTGLFGLVFAVAAGALVVRRRRVTAS